MAIRDPKRIAAGETNNNKAPTPSARRLADDDDEDTKPAQRIGFIPRSQALSTSPRPRQRPQPTKTLGECMQLLQPGAVDRKPLIAYRGGSRKINRLVRTTAKGLIVVTTCPDMADATKNENGDLVPGTLTLTLSKSVECTIVEHKPIPKTDTAVAAKPLPAEYPPAPTFEVV